MKTFEDLKFELLYVGVNRGVVGKCTLSNGYEISVAMNNQTYGGKEGLWEICVFENEKAYESIKLKCLNGETVEGYLTTKEVEEKMEEIQKELGIDDKNIQDAEMIEEDTKIWKKTIKFK